MGISLRVTTEWSMEAMKSFIVSFAIQTVATGNPTFGLVAGSLGIVATAVHAIITPLFRQSLKKDSLIWYKK